MSFLFNEILYRPLLNTLVFLYNTVAFGDLGIAIILLTILVRLLLYPLFYKGLKNQALLQKIQPHMKKIQHDHRHNKEEQARALLELYRSHKVNPFSSFLLLFAQIPVLLALYKVFSRGITEISGADLYAFITQPGTIAHTLLGLINLGESSTLLVGLAAIAQYVQGRMSLASGSGAPGANRVGQQMVFIGPILTALIFWRLPAAISLYWCVSSLITVAQQAYLKKTLHGQGDDNGRGTISGSDKTTV